MRVSAQWKILADDLKPIGFLSINRSVALEERAKVASHRVRHVRHVRLLRLEAENEPIGGGRLRND